MLRPVYRHAARRLQTPVQSAAVGRRHLHAPVKFDWQDPLNVSNLFTEEEVAISETAESYCQERMLPRVLGTPPHPEVVSTVTDVVYRGIPQ
jgi:glutaryl-CoA dehydrogenase